MYQPKHFSVTDQRAIESLVRDHSLATLMLGGSDQPEADHIPLLWVLASESPENPGRLQGSLQGHVARANPLWQRAAQSESAAPVAALAIFHGPQAYVSPSGYASKREHGKVVPTWNYMVVHISGRLVAHDDPVWLMQLLHRLTDTHEASLAKPWGVDDAPAPYIEQLSRAIVGIELVVERVEAKYKLSQNRPATDIAGVIAQLQSTAQAHATAVAGAMALQNEGALSARPEGLK
jgi:transcriptional regulator